MVWHIYWWAVLVLYLIGFGAIAESKGDPAKDGFKIVARLSLIPLFILAWKALP